MKFYSLKQGKSITVPHELVRYEMTENGRHMAVANHNGEKLYKFVAAKDAMKLNSLKHVTAVNTTSLGGQGFPRVVKGKAYGELPKSVPTSKKKALTPLPSESRRRI